MSYQDWTDWARMIVMSLFWIGLIGLIGWSSVKLARYPAQQRPTYRAAGEPRPQPSSTLRGRRSFAEIFAHSGRLPSGPRPVRR